MRLLLIAMYVIITNNPYILAGLLGVTLIVVSTSLALVNNFVAFVLFLVYVGGIIILVSYCVILTPLIKYSTPFSILLLCFVSFSFIEFPGTYVYGLLYSASTVFFVSILLFLVMCAVVSIIDYSRGMIYDKSLHLFFSCSCAMSPIIINNKNEV